MKKKDPEKYAKILAAAQTLILRDGAAAVSTTKVARSVGIAQSNIYIYFKNKDDMLRQVYTNAQATAQADFTAQTHADVDLRTAVGEYVDAMHHFASTNFATLELLHQIKALPDATWTQEINDQQTPVRLINAAIEAGILRPVAPAIIMSVIYNAIRQTALLTNAGTDVDYAEVRQLILSGILL